MAQFEIDSTYLVFDDWIKYIRINTSNVKYQNENTLNVEFILSWIIDGWEIYYDICYSLLEEIYDWEWEKVYKFLTWMMWIAWLNFPELSNIEVETFKTYIKNVFTIYWLNSGL